jgi:hypothetical protein
MERASVAGPFPADEVWDARPDGARALPLRAGERPPPARLRWGKVRPLGASKRRCENPSGCLSEDPSGPPPR